MLAESSPEGWLLPSDRLELAELKGARLLLLGEGEGGISIGLRPATPPGPAAACTSSRCWSSIRCSCSLVRPSTRARP